MTVRYKVLWTTYARVALARMKEYKVNPLNVFRLLDFDRQCSRNLQD